MATQSKAIWAAVLALSLAAPASATVNVWLEASDWTVNLGETVEVELIADASESIVAWGLDLTLDTPGVASLTDILIESPWDATDTLDGDGLAGLLFPSSVTGETLLATLTFEGTALGTTPLTLSYGPEEDEGFLTEFAGLDPDVSFIPASIEVVPEPATLSLLLTAAVFALRRRR